MKIHIVHVLCSLSILLASASSASGSRKLIDAGHIISNLPIPALAGTWANLLPLLDAHKGDSKPAIDKLKSYFAEFGYLPKNISTDLSFDDALESAVRSYQQNFRLPVTGNLDSATLTQLLKPRCGGEDIDPNGFSQMLQNHTHSSSQFTKHYAFFPGNPRWISKSALCYAFDESTMVTGLSADSVKSAFRRAFRRWSAIVPLNFTEISSISRADIVIEFAKFVHGDSHPFDGPLGVLAHAFSPEDGRFHLDASEDWSLDLRSDLSLTAIHLESVAVHEIGHLIGLGHSGDSSAIMYPSIAPRQVKTEFGQDDIDGAQALYGANPSYVPGMPIDVGTDSNQESSNAPAPQSRHGGIGMLCFLGLLGVFILL